MRSINDQIIKESRLDELPKIAQEIRQEIINCTALNGGHLASNLGIVEITMALHRNFNLPKDRLLFDVGHQSYAHKIISGRSLKTLRKKDGISGFQKRDESVYDVFEAGHSSTSLSTAIGMACARDLNHDDYDVIAVIGDASISSGMAFEALNDPSHNNHKIIIILNDNEMSISRPVGATTKLFSKIRISYGYNKAKGKYRRALMRTHFGSAIYRHTAKIKNAFKRVVLPNTYFEDLGLDYIGPIDGHDFVELEKALKNAKKMPKTVIVHCLTTKGKGYSFSENDKEGYWHGVAPFDATTGLPLYKKEGLSWSAFYSELIDEQMKSNANIVYINPAMIRGNEAERIIQNHPDRSYDVGIAEEHAISLASGFALDKKYPIVAIYSTFIQRSVDPINQDLCRMDLPSLLLIDRSGLVGADGETHQGIFEEAMLGVNPNLTIACPGNDKEARSLLSLAPFYPHPLAIRYPRDKVIYTNYDYQVTMNKWIWYKESKHLNLCLGNGPLFYKLFEKCQHLGINFDFLNALFLKPLDEDCLNKILDYKKIVIYSPYTIENGWVNNVLAYLLKNNYQGKIIIRAIPSLFIKQATIEQQLEDCHLSLTEIISLLLYEQEVI